MISATVWRVPDDGQDDDLYKRFKDFYSKRRDGEKVEYEFRPPEEVMRKLKNHAE